MGTLKKIICNYVDIQESDICDDMSLNAELGLDSMALILMLVDIEEAFGCEIPNSQLSNFQTLKDVYAYVSEKGTIAV